MMILQRVTQLQLVLLFIIFHFSTTTGFLIQPLALLASYQGWLVLLLAGAGGLIIAYFSVSLAKQRGCEFIVHYGKQLIGRWPHLIMMIIFSFYCIHLASIVLREFTDFLIQMFLPTTPSWVVAGLFVAVISIAVRSGIEAIFRCATGFFLVIFSTATMIPFLVGKDVEYAQAIALITNLNMNTAWRETIPFIPWFGEMFLVLFIFPWLTQPEKTFRSLIWASIISVGSVDLFYILCLLLFGDRVSANLPYPVLEMIRFIRVGDFLENLDPIVVAIWMSSIFIKISFLLYISVLIVSQLFGLKDTRPFSFSFGMILLGLSMHIVKNIIELRHFITYVWPSFANLVECSPIIYWVVSIIKKRRHGTKLGNS
jgi:spore germination protein KB